ncbi:hypothetical protein ACVWYN_002866 [Pedobacter sp. UYP24]
MKVKKIVWMKNKYKFNGLKDLQAKQLELKSETQLSGEHILANAKLIATDFSVNKLFKAKIQKKSLISTKKLNSNDMLSGKIVSFALPLLLNKTIFKGSGILTKTAVGLISSKTGAKIGGYLFKLLMTKAKV